MFTMEYHPGTIQKWTLQECVEYALENNISVKQSELDMELADIENLMPLETFCHPLMGRLQTHGIQV